LFQPISHQQSGRISYNFATLSFILPEYLPALISVLMPLTVMVTFLPCEAAMSEETLLQKAEAKSILSS